MIQTLPSSAVEQQRGGVALEERAGLDVTGQDTQVEVFEAEAEAAVVV